MRLLWTCILLVQPVGELRYVFPIFPVASCFACIYLNFSTRKGWFESFPKVLFYPTLSSCKVSNFSFYIQYWNIYPFSFRGGEAVIKETTTTTDSKLAAFTHTYFTLITGLLFKTLCYVYVRCYAIISTSFNSCFSVQQNNLTFNLHTRIKHWQPAASGDSVSEYLIIAIAGIEIKFSLSSRLA